MTNVWMRNGDESTIPGRLTSRRVQLGMDQIDVANKMGVARAAYSQYETGKVTPTLDKIIKAAEALETTPQWIAFGGMNHEIPILTYNSSNRTWVSTDQTWPVPASWIKDRLSNVDPHKLDAYEATTSSPSAMVQAGDVVLVDREEKPGTRLYQEFVFAMDGECLTDNLRKTDGGYLVGLAEEGKQPVLVNTRAIRILGKVVAVFGAP
ncbi:transcriptional regulator [Caulobacter phage CcrBL9]|uniref:Putative HTH DNA binding protein n=1 Tax=Caulobacter phage CcrBL9 TaxID=2283270 RepID=A0A385EBH4_9CAUD|nr:transcriptional regulator [Caulobacter phage CcrBL9]AXQ69234.1 putative HTH DNA binding protein [Caulobacter phage CcrBL9]